MQPLAVTAIADFQNVLVRMPMFTLDSSRHYIEADEQDIVALYRSSSAIIIKPADFPAQPCEAYLCIIKDGELLGTFVALHLSTSKEILVYTPEINPVDSAELRNMRQEAMGFVESMGFKLEEVNLNYSTALREVVIRNISVLHPPVAGKKSAGKKAAAIRPEGAKEDQQAAILSTAKENYPAEKAEFKMPPAKPVIYDKPADRHLGDLKSKAHKVPARRKRLRRK